MRLYSNLLAHHRAFSVLVALLLIAPVVNAAELSVAYIDGVESSTKAQMLQHILEVNTDYEVTLKKTSVEDLWAGVAEGRYDSSVSVLLPQQAPFMKRYAEQVEDLGPNWIGPNFSIHTIVRKDYERDDIVIVRFLNNYCLCGERLTSAMALNADGKITRQNAIDWMAEHGPWITNMMGFTRPYDDREERNVTY